MVLFKGYPEKENIPKLSDISYDDRCTSIRISLFKKLVVVSKNDKYGIILMEDELLPTSTDIVVCECKYDDITPLHLNSDEFCDFHVSKGGRDGIGRVSFSVDKGFTYAEYSEILPCIFRRERTNDSANVIQFSIDEDYVRYYHILTNELSAPYTQVRSGELFITCFNHDVEEITFVHNLTNKAIFRAKAYHCHFIGHYKEGEVYMLDYFDDPFLVFCNDKECRAFVTDEFEDIRSEVIWNKCFGFLTRLFYKRNDKWHTLLPTEDVISQDDISELTKAFDKAIL